MITNGRLVREVAESLGIGENLIYNWRSRQESKVTEEKENALGPIKQALLKHIRELKTERDMDPMLTHVCWSKSLSYFQPADLKERYRFVQQQTAQWLLQIVCQMLQLSRSASYS